ncbi:ATP-dependent DNA helicase [Acidithiobacillus sp.]
MQKREWFMARNRAEAEEDWGALLGAEGPLASCLPHFRPRAQQVAMAEAVARVLVEGGTALIEAGTGTGKTFAYLLPAFLSGRKVLISTGSKALQDQILEKDVPLLLQTLGRPLHITRLKGRSNYLCRHRLQRFATEGVVVPELARQLEVVACWAGQTREGDIGELAALAEDAQVWPLVTSTKDNCLGSDCPDYAQCHVMEARRRAQEADILVVNHHLLFSDLALKAEGMGDLLPRVEAMIIDEAHQVADLASRFFGQHLSSHQLLEWARDTMAEGLQEAPDDGEISARAEAMLTAVEAWRALWTGVVDRGEWQSPGQDAAGGAYAALITAAGALAATLTAAACRGKGLEQCGRRAGELLEALAFFASANAKGTVFWYERRGRGLSLHGTPLDIAEPFRRHLLDRVERLVLTSATLSVDGGFAHLERALGLEGAQSLALASPFDYAGQSVLYLPPRLPDPGSQGFTVACLEAALPVLRAAGGRAFFLFTSHRALQEAAVWLPGRLDYPILVQGSMARPRLLEAFRRLGNAVLLGAASFWEGVDVQGEALSCVIIDKLPFTSPADPLFRARSEQCQSSGGDAFREVQVPQAVIALRQGAGRLIRSEADRGALMLCDPRLQSRSYGRIFLNSLPPMRKVYALAEVEAFLRA